jgi:hypothetical protein
MSATKAKPAAADKTPEQTLDPRERRAIDELEQFINRAMTEAGQQHEKIADRLFTVLFEGDVAAALAIRVGMSAKYDVLTDRAGRTLLMERVGLSRAVRVGALNRRLDGTKWSTLPWSTKLELLPLVGPDLDFDRLQKGVAFAAKAGNGREAVREWVAARRAADAGDTTTVRALTPVKARKMLEIGANLQRIAERRLLADRLRKLDDDSRAEWLAALTLTLRSLSRLHEELMDTSND